MLDTATLDWLLDTDPALRWQVERDLVGAPPAVWEATRARVATEGIGARLLALQDADGQWAGGAYWPAQHDGSPGQPWVATTWSLNSLREWGLDAAVLGDTADRLAAHSRWEYDDLPYWGGEVDCCINGYTLENGLWLGIDVTGIADWFVEHQLADGGWNCAWVDGATVSSFHSTLNAVKGLAALERAGLDGAGLSTAATREARRAGEEYLLERRLHRRRSTGEPVADWTTAFAYPTRWRYDVLRATDHLRAASAIDGTPPDPRAAEAVGLIEAARQPDGRWLQGPVLPGRVWFDVDVQEGQASPWLTFLASRVLAWWHG